MDLDLDLNVGGVDLSSVGAPYFVVFATPTLSHGLSAEYVTSMAQTGEFLRRAGIPYVTHFVGGDPYLPKVRNQLATQFLRDHLEATDLFWIDDDVGWQPEAVQRMLEADADVIAGVYPKKQETVAFPCELDIENGGLVWQGPLLRAKMVPTGFLRIRRHVMEKLAAVSPRYRGQMPTGEQEHIEFFTTGIDPDDGEWCGEDVAFCRRWRKMGGEVWIDPDITFSHVGRYRWVNNIGQAVKAELDHLAKLQAEAANDVEPGADGVAANDTTKTEEVA